MAITGMNHAVLYARHARRSPGAPVGAGDHGVNKSLYAVDPDGLEFEVTWVVPPHPWGDQGHEAVIRPLDIAADRRRYATIAGTEG
jgi:catechol-2,3-dioxygenase